MSRRKASTNEDVQSRDILQAVLLADSFESKFRPLTCESPKVLMPLVNVPMLEYSLEFLISSGVEHIIVYASAHANQIQDFLDARPASLTSKCRIQLVKGVDCLSAGDAMRHLYTKDIISSTFVLVSGDVISNMSLQRALEAHKARYKADKRNVLTMVLKKAVPGHPTRTLDDDTVLAIDPDTARLVHYSNDFADEGVNLPISMAFMDDVQRTHLRYDLMDANVDICAPEVLDLFQENPDWQSLRPMRVRSSTSLVGGLLDNFNVLGCNIFTHVVSGEYAARLRDFHTYDSVSRDIIRRWTDPIVPEANLFAPTTYTFARRHIYMERGVTVERTANVAQGCVIGSGSQISTGSLVHESVLGRSVRIGARSRVLNSYIWEGTVLGEGVTVLRSLIGHNCRIGANAVIAEGCVLQDGCVVPPNTKLPPHTRLSAAKYDWDDRPLKDSRQAEEKASDFEKSLGPRAWLYTNHTAEEKGSLWQEEGEDEDAEDTDGGGEGGGSGSPVAAAREAAELQHLPAVLRRDVVRRRAILRKGILTVNSLAPSLEAKQLCEHKDPLNARLLWMMSDVHSDLIEAPLSEEDQFEKFQSQVYETLKGHFGTDREKGGVQLELASLKLSFDMSLQQYAAATVKAILRLSGVKLRKEISAGQQESQAEAPAFSVPTRAVLAQFDEYLDEWDLLIKKFRDSEQDQSELIMGVEDLCSEDQSFLKPYFRFILQLLYQNDILDSDGILEWHRVRQIDSQNGDADAAEWLKLASSVVEAAGEESDDEGDEYDSDDEGDETEEEEKIMMKDEGHSLFL